MCLIEQTNQFIPASIKHFIGIPQTSRQQPGVCPLCNLLLDWFAKEQAGKKPL